MMVRKGDWQVEVVDDGPLFLCFLLSLPETVGEGGLYPCGRFDIDKRHPAGVLKQAHIFLRAGVLDFGRSHPELARDDDAKNVARKVENLLGGAA